MLRKATLIPGLFVLLLLTAVNSYAQRRTTADTLLVGAVVEGKDTIPMIYLDEVLKEETLPPRLAKKRAAYNKLRYNVTKAYPYAVIAAEVLKDVDVTLAKLENNKKGRKEYLKGVEKELNRRFKGELEDLTITQGQILVKLINRQTGKNCFGIIKELKGGFSAVIWQSVALLFSNSLKKEYDPQDRDRDIEKIVAELEASNYYKYQYQMQKNRLHSRAN